MLTRISILSVVCMVFATALHAEEYTDPSGFSFTAPAGWVVANKLNMNLLSPEAADLVRRNNINLDQISVFVIRSGGELFHENINVTVAMEELPANAASLKQFGDGVQQQVRKAGGVIKKFDSRLGKIGDRDVLILEARFKFMGTAADLANRQVMVPGGGKSYVITCTALESTFEKYAPTFDQVTESFKAPPPSAPRGIAAGALNGAVAGGIVGAVAGALGVAVFALLRLFGRNKSKGRDDGPRRPRSRRPQPIDDDDDDLAESFRPTR